MNSTTFSYPNFSLSNISLCDNETLKENNELLKEKIEYIKNEQKLNKKYNYMLNQFKDLLKTKMNPNEIDEYIMLLEKAGEI